MVFGWPEVRFPGSLVLWEMGDGTDVSRVHRERSLLRNLAAILHSEREDFHESHRKSEGRFSGPWNSPECGPQRRVEPFKQHAGIQVGPGQCGVRVCRKCFRPRVCALGSEPKDREICGEIMKLDTVLLMEQKGADAGTVSNSPQATASDPGRLASIHHKPSLAPRSSGDLDDASIALDVKAGSPRELCALSTCFRAQSTSLLVAGRASSVFTEN